MDDAIERQRTQGDMTATLAARLAGEVRLGSTAAVSAATTSPPSAAVILEDVAVSFGDQVAVRNTTMSLAANRVTALVGPSGCGKTSILRAVNRLHDHTGGTVSGTIRLGDLDVYAPGTSPELVRSKVGMVFQRPNPFPTMSIFDNVVSGLRFNGVRSKALLAEAGEAALRHAALWDIVKDRLRDPAIRLSGGQQQRLCIARALAVEPDLLLMDEPCSALDPVATGKIEALIAELAEHLTVVLVTHNMFQAARVSDDTAVFLLGDDRVGELVEFGPTADVFGSPRDERTRAYVTGHIG
jgi:phosphate transport system ATP-binding protein